MKTKFTTLMTAIFCMVTTIGLMAQDVAGPFNTDDSGIALAGYSPVSYMEQQKAVKGNKNYKAEHGGVTYYFASANEMKKFNANPEKYTPEYGGWCALGIGLGKHFRTDPNNFIVENGKLYLFLNNLEVDAKAVWQEDEKKWGTEAEKNWKKLHG